MTMTLYLEFFSRDEVTVIRPLEVCDDLADPGCVYQEDCGCPQIFKYRADLGPTYLKTLGSPF